METNEKDRVIWRHNLQSLLSVSSETMRRWIKEGRLPKPDVAMSQKTMGWRLSTLRVSGINIAI
jgi:predicted DNA-binding transcriptional regulator AlpA